MPVSRSDQQKGCKVSLVPSRSLENEGTRSHNMATSQMWPIAAITRSFMRLAMRSLSP